MSGWIAGAGVGSALIGGGIGLMGQQAQAGQSAQAMQMAMQNYLLQKRMADQQYELSTAGKTDARGNKTRYVPGQGWVVDVTPTTRSLINESDALQGVQQRKALTTGQDDSSRNFNRRLQEGQAASPLLDQLMYKYGAPTKEGVVGRQKIADVTQASETGDLTKGGYASAALRTGLGNNNLGSTIASADKGTTAGIRTALAKADNSANPMFDEMMAKWRGGISDPYNQLASRASAVDGQPGPESISGGLDSSVTNSQMIGANTGGRGAVGINGAASPLIASMLAQKQPNYGATFGASADALLDYFKKSRTPTNGNMTSTQTGGADGWGGMNYPI